LEHFEAIPKDASVWNYVNRSYALDIFEKVKNSNEYSDWLKNRALLNNVILLDRFLRFNENYFVK
jgi:hypothetical protein